MKSVPKLIRRYVGLLLLSSLMLLLLNAVVFAIIASKQLSNGSPWVTAAETAKALQSTEQGIVLSKESTTQLQEAHAWAILIDNTTLQVVWKSDHLPNCVPLSYTASSISNVTRGYIAGYPTFTGESENGLLVLGYPKESYWKHMWPSWDYHLIANLPKILLAIVFANILLLLIIYVLANSKLLTSIKPIINGIQSLSTSNPVHILEKGLLSELAVSINQTSEILQKQKSQLRRKETARANWIAGVSHDIRTPLSMVMGYAGQLESDTHLTEEQQKKAMVILRQSQKMQNLINDLNLASKLEYNMQPIQPSKMNAVAVVRQVVVDFMNTDIDHTHPIEWETDTSPNTCLIQADQDLLRRAIMNLIQNSINHNENGCTIYVTVQSLDDSCMITVADNGVGATDEQIHQLNTTPHYMVCDDTTTEQRHGLGLLIVKQILAVHNGQTIISHSQYGGFCVKLILPLCKR
ncbi:sensor histidine kinase [Anaerosporobacter faecicola]|uniref:sensor histidine kinase n=1 Tax=Anaerosporobacter faecicola TaxID=2718714 RepID=UPI00143BB0C2|nr:HAMP domain-containing sensor histidine kinase [Anaerosporobacter faecicola]